MSIANRRHLRSGELAKLTGVSTDTLRHYERLGLLQRPTRSAAGYRQYPPEAARRVRLVRGALGIGFTLEELAGILKVRDRGGAPCHQVHAMAVAKLADLDRRIVALTEFREQFRSILAQWENRLLQTPSGQRAGLLESLAALPDSPLSSSSPSASVSQRRSARVPRS